MTRYREALPECTSEWIVCAYCLLLFWWWNFLSIYQFVFSDQSSLDILSCCLFLCLYLYLFMSFCFSVSCHTLQLNCHFSFFAVVFLSCFVTLFFYHHISLFFPFFLYDSNMLAICSTKFAYHQNLLYLYSVTTSFIAFCITASIKIIIKKNVLKWQDISDVTELM